MRIALAGTELAPVRLGAGGLESLLWGWAGGLGAAGHDVHVLSLRGGGVGDGDGDVQAAGFEEHRVDGPEGLGRLLDRLAPDVAVINNRPGWQRRVHSPTLHLLHNWPDAWGLGGAGPPAVGGAALAAVSGALARVVAAGFGRDDVSVLRPFVDKAFSAAEAAPQPDVVLAPNRLMAKKGVAELVAAGRRDELAGVRFLVTDFISPWREPTAEHRRLRALVEAAPGCRLVPPPASRREMAALYASAGAVVVPSVLPEGLGMTAIEAQAVGVPVVSSGLGGLAEATLAPGLVADPRDPAALAAALLRALAVGPEPREELRGRVAAGYSLEASLETLLAAAGRAGRG